jgi:colanic acid/amylovoran biosynthesis glycosyltransferase
MLDRLRELGCPPAKLRLQRISVDVRRFEPPLSRAGSPPRVLTVARLVEKRGVDTLLHALASLRAELPELCCEVIGDGPLRGRLEALAVELGLGGRVVFRGACPEQEVVAAMQAAHCFVLASRQAEDGDEEGTPTVLMEASSAALPVIGTRHAGVAEIVKDGETGLLVPPADPGALATALRRLLADAALRQAMGERGRAHVAAVFDQPLLSRRLQELYEEVDREATPARRSS